MKLSSLISNTAVKGLSVVVLFFTGLTTSYADDCQQVGDNKENVASLVQECDEPETSVPMLERAILQTKAEGELSESHLYKALIRNYEAEKKAQENYRAILPHKPNYVMPVTYQNKINRKPYESFTDETGTGDLEPVELVFQLSIKYQLAEDVFTKGNDISVGYTNRSFWQAYNSGISAPFRDTNHEPEIIMSFSNLNMSWLDYYSISLNHQSNGQPSVLSRSWNRVIMTFAKVWPNSALVVSPWWRVPETSKADPADPSDNDNPDIHQYLGYGELFYLRLFDQHSVGLHLRNNFNFDNNRGSASLEWNFPLNNRTKGFIQYFAGYGETLLDYNHYQERIGVGIKLSDWL